MYEPTRQFLSSNVAGFSHWYGLEVFEELRPGTTLDLVPEFDNPHDSQAIAVYYKDVKIGYVPARLNGTLSQFLFFGYGDLFTCKVSQVAPDAHSEQQVFMTIFLRDGRSPENQ